MIREAAGATDHARDERNAIMATEPENQVEAADDEQAKPPFLRRVRIRGYKSIAFCDVTLEPLTILVGRNASGKSNFIDALAFLRDSIQFGLAEAMRLRGGLRGIVCRSVPTDRIEIEIESMLIASRDGKEYRFRYRVEFRVNDGNHFDRPLEELTVADVTNNIVFGFRTQQDRAIFFGPGEENSGFAINLFPDLFLRIDVRDPDSDLVYALRYMGFYNFHPDSIRHLQTPTPGWLLERDGSNLASVIETTRENEEETIARVGRYLAVITESVGLLGVAKYGDYETVRFRIARTGQGQPLEFDAASMSDGTLRALAALVAAFQNVPRHGSPSLVAIEEPESSLHPAATRALVDALDEATLRTQILLTTQSAEMLDNPTIRPENIRVVQMIDGQTVIGPVDEASVEIVRRKLNTLGRLERDNPLEPDPDDLDRQRYLGQARQELPA
jgi:predicted ATPase